jgi:hypothetical protein
VGVVLVRVPVRSCKYYRYVPYTRSTWYSDLRHPSPEHGYKYLYLYFRHDKHTHTFATNVLHIIYIISCRCFKAASSGVCNLSISLFAKLAMKTNLPVLNVVRSIIKKRSTRTIFFFYRLSFYKSLIFTKTLYQVALIQPYYNRISTTGRC